MPAFNGHVTQSTSQHIIDRVDKRPCGLKDRALSTARRVNLAQSTILSIPFYAMQFTRLPESIYDDVDKKLRKFIWGG